MERREVEYFLAVAENGSFTAAARALRIAQPSLSAAIGQLENRLGGKLFHRLPHGVRLTQAGEALLEPARQVVRDLSTARDSVRQVLGLTAGRLDIVAQTTLAVDPLAGLLGEFLHHHPKVDVRVLDPELGAAVTSSVRAGECELGMVDTTSDPDDLEGLRLPGREVYAVLPPGGHDRKRIGLSELAALDFVATPPGTATRAVIEDVVAARDARPRVAVETAHQAMIVPLVLAGAGATLLPESMAAGAAREGATVLPLRPKVVRGGRLFWRPGPLAPAAARFVELASGLARRSRTE
ncbi:MAG: LysR family transcriptional regulator [Saccharopolyspora sp.]|uniref:LysR family transcriptional regulator n=1 Tax=Saccharopolyspora TaxID=1835 RepID=UPI00190BB557|nr:MULTISPECIES: LysR family transcriptional regulator [unclassified Saccharopolyspora]MBK0868237.1 LysR family transcriptional regulator [Saccharopolyspora sp. HNM0986]MBQ6644964.1 LysR family transcriptional regulator [Saccharopolyspora sp.]